MPGPRDAPIPDARRRDSLIRLGRWTLALAAPVFVVSLLLITAMTSYSHGTPTPVRVLKDLWKQSLEGDEEIFILLALVLWTLSWSYGIASVVVFDGHARVAWVVALIGASLVTPCGAALERCWHPHRALGNSLLALVWAATFTAAWVLELRRLRARLPVPPG